MATKKPPTFAQAYSELQTIVQAFEQQDLDLETSIPRFKRATVLVKFLKAELQKMENEIETINLDQQPSP